MKKFRYIVIIIFGAFAIKSCSDESNNISEFEKTPEALAEFFESDEYKTLNSNFSSFSLGLDESTFIEFMENDITMYSVQSKSGDKLLGNLIFAKTEDGVYVTVVEQFLYNVNGTIGKFLYDDVSGARIGSFKSVKIDDQTYSLELEKVISKNSEGGRSWLTCSAECISDAWGACSNDPGCDFICTVTGPGCPGSLATACGIWCAQDSNNDLTPETELDDTP